MAPKKEKKGKGSTMGEVVTREYTINMHKGGATGELGSRVPCAFPSAEARHGAQEHATC